MSKKKSGYSFEKAAKAHIKYVEELNLSGIAIRCDCPICERERFLLSRSALLTPSKKIQEDSKG